ncbi:MAG: efflux RND transporter permease subunit [Myxococcales bacterium]|nr:efflux RND transporter permease subunit [Myxococcales bacterium]
MSNAGKLSGVLAWMARNSVASNLLMAVLIGGGLMVLPSVKREVFPEFDLDMVTVSIPYPGASPAEVEQGAVLAVEEAVRGLDGVKEVRATANENIGVVIVELLRGTNGNKALADVKSAVDRIASFPADAERPVVSLAAAKRDVLSLILYGDTSETELRRLAEQARDGLMQHPEITLAELYSGRPLEISIEVPQEKLRRHGLTLEQVAMAVRNAAVELPGGGVKTRRGEVLLRVAERRELGPEFADIIVVSRPDGTHVRLADLADIEDAFAETDQEMTFDGKPAIRIRVYRVGDEGPIGVSRAVHEYMSANTQLLPEGIQMAVWDDRSEMYRGRMDLLRRNSILGLILVIGVLGLFLQVRLAFWVTMGIPISFIGSLLFLPLVDVSINMISLFAFIVTLGMVVDDAIIVGEAVFKQQRDGHGLLEAAVRGVREVAVPVTFSILTTIIAFLPLLFVPGTAGKFFRNIPLVVISVLAISLIESVFVLPAHLAEKKHLLTDLLSAPFRFVDALVSLVAPGRTFTELAHAQQQRFSRGLEWFVDHIYGRALGACLAWRYLTAAVCIGLLLMTFGVVAGGHVKFTFLPKIDGDVIAGRIEMPVGTPVEVTRRHQRHMIQVAQELLAEHGSPERLSRGLFAEIGGPGFRASTATSAQGGLGGHVADVMLFLVPSDERDFASGDLAREWRERVGDIPGVESISFRFSTGRSSNPIQVRLSHPDPPTLEAAAVRLADKIRSYSGTYDVQDGAPRGKEQLDLKLRPEARSLGLTQVDLARQVRSAFFGAEALRQQRGRDEVRVFVRRPLAERDSEAHIEGLMIRTPEGGELPLGQAATVERGRAYTRIERTNGRRTVDVISDLDDSVANAAEIQRDLEANFIPQLLAETPQLTYSMEGQGRDRAEMMSGLGRGFIAAVVAMFALLAVAFRSYYQPMIVLLAIPFGVIGAVAGHVVMGYSLSLMTMFGVVALSGVVVNDSLVLVVAVNRFREEGMSTWEAVNAGGRRRFRPILLTSLTTFFGLVPMITETSTQARFLIPMAISLGFGVLFATFVILVLVPCAYLILDDIGDLTRRLLYGTEASPGAAVNPREA